MKRNSSNSRVITDYELIREELEILGQKKLVADMSREKEYMYVDKLLTYADVPSFGKHKANSSDKEGTRVYSKENLQKRAQANYLFYYKEEQIIRIEKKQRPHFFCETKQSNITLPIAFYQFIGTKNAKSTDLSESRFTVLLVNNCISGAFDEDSTNELFSKLNRPKMAKKIEISNADEYTEIPLSTGVHGIGTSKDKFFHSLRGNVFAKDKLSILVEKKEQQCTIYIMFYRNPRYYQLRHMAIPVCVADSFTEIEEEKYVESRTGQKRWRNALAELALIREDGTETDYVICPFSMIEVRYPSEETLLRASHIKAYAKCRNSNGIDESEAYDPDNGFLVTANVDALFDKYFLSVNPTNNKIVKSKQLSKELIEALHIQDKISPEYVNERKKKYLKEHYDEFIRREEKRD